ncbi:hypothetical protein SAMN06296386_108148 [Lachnospiraceae bacterium]|nr:hypothetical protein SAMN06296386_108148 [Lachnospiraceae bacterium]
MSNEDESRMEPVLEERENTPGTAEEPFGVPPEEGIIPIAAEEKHLKTKTIPAVVMLLGGLATAVMCFMYHMDLLSFLVRVFGSLFFFWVIGGIVKIILDKIVIKEHKEAAAEVLEDIGQQENADAVKGTAEKR